MTQVIRACRRTFRGSQSQLEPKLMLEVGTASSLRQQGAGVPIRECRPGVNEWPMPAPPHKLAIRDRARSRFWSAPRFALSRSSPFTVEYHEQGAYTGLEDHELWSSSAPRLTFSAQTGPPRWYVLRALRHDTAATLWGTSHECARSGIGHPRRHACRESSWHRRLRSNFWSNPAHVLVEAGIPARTRYPRRHHHDEEHPQPRTFR